MLQGTSALPRARAALSEMNVVDIANLFEELESKDQVLLVFRLLSKDLSADVFAYLDPDHQQTIIESISDREISAIVSELFIDDAVDLLEELPANVVRRVLRNTDEQTRRIINEFLKYPEQSAGSIMTIEYVDLREQYTVADAIKRIRRTGVDKETIYTCYVTDATRKLLGVVALRKLLTVDEDTLIGDVMDENVQFVHTLDDQEAVTRLMREYDLLSMPVVDNEDRLVGIITIDDAVDVIDEEATEDFEKMAAMMPSEDEYLKTSVWQMARNRIPWLLFLMVSATLSGLVIARFEHAIQAVVMLAMYIPMLTDTGGNCGAQSSTLVIRGMALGEIEAKNVFSILWKEVRVSLMVGLILAVCNFARVMLFDRSGAMVALTVSMSLIVIVFASKVIGCMLPLLAKKLRVDPAIMASPLITTIVDVLALVVYFNIAVWLLGIPA
ncbi:MAG: magnesium transporter [Oscillospiraceae bacterium]|nr:magnesium transporter [Oscillospiraceae bacterium]